MIGGSVEGISSEGIMGGCWMISLVDFSPVALALSERERTSLAGLLGQLLSLASVLLSCYSAG